MPQGLVNEANFDPASLHVSAGMNLNAVRRSLALLQGLVNEVNRLAQGCKTRIAALDTMNRDALERREYTPDSAPDRMRSSVTAALRKKLKDSMGEFSALRTCEPSTSVA